MLKYILFTNIKYFIRFSKTLVLTIIIKDYNMIRDKELFASGEGTKNGE